MDAVQAGKIRNAIALALIGVAILGAAHFFRKKSAEINPLGVDRIEPADELNPNRKDIVHLRDGTAIEDIGYHLNSIGSYSDDGTFAALFFLGKECQECDDQVDREQLYVYSTSDSRNNRFDLPARTTLEPKEGESEGELISETRIFYGKCLPELETAMLIYRSQKSGMETQLSAEIWSFNSAHAFTRAREESSPPVVNLLLSNAAQSVGAQCKELPGVEQILKQN